MQELSICRTQSFHSSSIIQVQAQDSLLIHPFTHDHSNQLTEECALNGVEELLLQSGLAVRARSKVENTNIVGSCYLAWLLYLRLITLKLKCTVRPLRHLDTLTDRRRS